MHNYDAQQHRAGQIISPLTLQTLIIAQMLSVGGRGRLGSQTRGKSFTHSCNSTDNKLTLVSNNDNNSPFTGPLSRTTRVSETAPENKHSRTHSRLRGNYTVSPLVQSEKGGTLVQRLLRWTYDQRVMGSNPTRPRGGDALQMGR